MQGSLNLENSDKVNKGIPVLLAVDGVRRCECDMSHEYLFVSVGEWWQFLTSSHAKFLDRVESTWHGYGAHRLIDNLDDSKYKALGS